MAEEPEPPKTGSFKLETVTKGAGAGGFGYARSALQRKGSQHELAYLVICRLGLDLASKDILGIGELVLIHDVMLDSGAVPFGILAIVQTSDS